MSTLLFCLGVAGWAESVRHYRRWRPAPNGGTYKRPLSWFLFVSLGFASPYLVTARFGRWLISNIWHWDVMPRINWMRAQRAQRVQTQARAAGAVLQQAAQQVAVPKVAAPAQPAVTFSPAAVLVRQADGTATWEMIQ